MSIEDTKCIIQA